MTSIVLAALAGLLVSFALEGVLQPRPVAPTRRKPSDLALHVGIWLAAYCLLTLILGRPWFAMTVVSAGLLTLIMVNNAKYLALREPFVFQDYDYFIDAIRHPRLYIPFLGWGRAIAAALGIAAAIGLGFWAEDRLQITPQTLGAYSGMGALAAGLILFGHRWRSIMTFEPVTDLTAHGLLSALWHYGHAYFSPVPSWRSPLLAAEKNPDDSAETLPHIVAVQSESFFDPRTLWPDIAPSVTAGLDRLGAEAVAAGTCRVPAWGANTVRSEFAFLSGFDADNLGVHRFNPYRAFKSDEHGSLARALKNLGYRTLCIHPYPISFYDRQRVYPLLGFDEFIDLAAFTPADKFGPYTADQAIAERIRTLLAEAEVPTFIFVITMENHGPLHLEKVAPDDIATLYTAPPPAGTDDLTIYLRHLRNASRMAEHIAETLTDNVRPGWLCWYGDHVPIMSTVYEKLGMPDGRTPYFIWHTDVSEASGPGTHRNASELAQILLKQAGFLRNAPPSH
ncbi:hypothetical protein A9404_03705 [Halothiobacillus diazotrophicus]|uniref:Sulfatase N-terminal domain-containing protein n=1 Tax=Halothiobacillus diazotrophicus TaxID=1860122 RepID=A0A191ZFH1_9GAMM|nr:LTA synthase family protein [Halothiobacillus diazotrophicus]ANJ66602.1 hypothetical protein A9404_03705 [Halothiobacillus diazotrophicus]